VSFGNRMRAKQSRGALMALALIASAGMAGIAAPPAPTGVSAPNVVETPKVFADTSGARKGAQRKKKVGTRRPMSGNVAWDSRKARRRIIMHMAGRPNTGRQWVRVRRLLGRSPLSYLMHTPAHKLAVLAASNKITWVRVGGVS